MNKIMTEVGRIRIAYIGFSETLIRLLIDSKYYILEAVVTASGKLSDDLCCQLSNHNIKVYYVEKKEDLLSVFNLIETRVYVMFKFNLIIPNDAINNRKIYNIHYGDLRTNRGAHSHRWSILLGEKTTKITIYQIDGLDEGYIVKEIVINIDDNDDVISLEEKMESKLDDLLISLHVALIQNSKVGLTRVYKGIYRGKLKEEDFTIDIMKDTYEKIKNKINCVIDFGGGIAHLHGEKVRVNDVLLVKNSKIEMSKSGQKSHFFTTIDGEDAVLIYESYKFT